MTLGQAIATVFGGFLFPFVIRMVWGKMVETFGAPGGWVAAAFVVGTLWTINHGLDNPMITQSGGVWIDMAVAGGVGVYVASAVKGGKIKGSLTNLAAALPGGGLGGFILSLFL
ncbi:hypothetical protein [Jeotgalibaca porci]|uniref:Lin0368 family putative glycerol transporter subunit n=1 Tax=Jeotgalibaca porci TaxID=1868793 RepID=UPI00359FF7BC